MQNKQDIITFYNSGKSLREVAEKFNVSATTIMRIIKKYGKLREKSEAQRNAIVTGRAKHPTKGKKRDLEVRQRIGKKVEEAWNTIDEAEYERRINISKENWKNMDEEKKSELRTKSAKAIRAAAANGSKLEHLVREFLIKNGFNVLIHKKELVPNTKLECDILVPELKTVIELDGPSHYLDIWGQERLQKTQRADHEKNGLLLQYGYVIIRLRYPGEALSLQSKQRLEHQLLELMNRVKTGLKQEEKLIIVEVK